MHASTSLLLGSFAAAAMSGLATFATPTADEAAGTVTFLATVAPGGLTVLIR